MWSINCPLLQITITMSMFGQHIPMLLWLEQRLRTLSFIHWYENEKRHFCLLWSVVFWKDVKTILSVFISLSSSLFSLFLGFLQVLASKNLNTKFMFHSPALSPDHQDHQSCDENDASDDSNHNSCNLSTTQPTFCDRIFLTLKVN